MRLLVSGGGTGGHVYPILAVLDALSQLSGPASKPVAPVIPAAAPVITSTQSVQTGLMASVAGSLALNELSPAAPVQANEKPAAAPQSSASRAAAESSDEILYIGVSGAVEEELARRAGVQFQAIESGQVRGMAPWVAARNLLKAAKGSRQARTLIAEFRPDVVFVTGGYVAGPVVLAASRAGQPVFIYLPDVEPGLAIQRMSRFARKIGVTFPEVARYFPGKAVVTGYPVRPEILALAGQKAVARQRLGLGQEEPVLLVFGGSRGARSINQALAAALPDLLPRCQVVHISGTLDWPDVEAFMQSLSQPLRGRYHAYPYLHDEMPLALAAADLVVARAGASTLGEFPALALPSILAPYPYSGQHQDHNAAYLADRGAAIKLADAELNARLAPAIHGLLEDPAVLEAMSEAAKALAQPDAAAAIARELIVLAQNSRDRHRLWSVE